LDKPVGWTSHDCVARLRRLARTKKVGHAGTLDPDATGLLVLGVGKATRLLTYLVGLDKVYSATIRLGASTTTDDAAGEVIAETAASGLALDAVEHAMAVWRGRVMQVPSAVSAIKVSGKRAYARVRAGEKVELRPREVTIHRFEMVASRVAGPFLDLDVVVGCSSGTYVRALARDLGAELGVGGHLVALRRLAVGPFGIDDARTLESLAEDFSVWPMAAAARRLWPVQDLSEDEARRLSHGQSIPARARPDTSPTDSGQDSAHSPDTRGPVAAIAPDGHLVALIASTDLGMVPIPADASGVDQRPGRAAASSTDLGTVPNPADASRARQGVRLSGAAASSVAVSEAGRARPLVVFG
jgi:tRNA pseudouridine55 synthase